MTVQEDKHEWYEPLYGKRLVIAYANSKGSGEPAHARSLARACAARSP